MTVQTFRQYEDFRMGDQLCKDYLIKSVAPPPSGSLATMLGIMLLIGASVAIGHNLK